jgi:cyanate lyase
MTPEQRIMKYVAKQDNGLSFEKVSAWLGHADVRITQQRYAFLKIEQLHDAIKKPESSTPLLNYDSTASTGPSCGFCSGSPRMMRAAS